jgi:hypothetical protein
MLLVGALLLVLVACTDSSRSSKIDIAEEKEGSTKIDGDTNGGEGAAAKKKKRPKRPAVDDLDINDLHLEVVALQALAELQLTRAQLKALAEVAEKTAMKPGPRKEVKVTAKYRRTLASLRDALAAGDDELTEEHTEALEALREKEAPEFDEIEITDAARKEAPGMLKRLNARQIVGYISGEAAFPDPGESLREGLAQSRELSGKNWRELRDDAVEKVSSLVAGLDSKAEQKVRARALALLNKAHRLTEQEYTAQKADLEKEAMEIAGKVDAFQVVRHYMERAIAELLSNPRLGAALAARRKKAV